MNRREAIALGLGAWALACSGARAGALDELQSFLDGTRSARGTFTQHAQGGAPGGAPGGAESSSGVFAFSRPGRFRWEVREPFEQLLVADGEQLWFYDKDLNQVTIRSLKDALESTPAAILFGSSDIVNGFVLRELPAHDGLDWLEALPRSHETGFESIEFGFRNGLPAVMSVKDAFGRTTRFEFGSIERNVALAPDLFRFVTPPGVDVVKQ